MPAGRAVTPPTAPCHTSTGTLETAPGPRVHALRAPLRPSLARVKGRPWPRGPRARRPQRVGPGARGARGVGEGGGGGGSSPRCKAVRARAPGRGPGRAGRKGRPTFGPPAGRRGSGKRVTSQADLEQGPGRRHPPARPRSHPCRPAAAPAHGSTPRHGGKTARNHADRCHATARGQPNLCVSAVYLRCTERGANHAPENKQRPIDSDEIPALPRHAPLQSTATKTAGRRGALAGAWAGQASHGAGPSRAMWRNTPKSKVALRQSPPPSPPTSSPAER